MFLSLLIFGLIIRAKKFSVPAETITVNFGEKQENITAYTPTTGTEPITRLKNTNSIDLEVGDHPLILQFSH